jgi:hypothetical protein
METQDPSTRPEPRLDGWLYLALATAASVSVVGYRFGGSNHSVQIPILKHYLKGELFRNDLLLSSLDGYASLFFPLMARAARWFGGIELLYFVVYVAFQALTLHALATLARDVFGAGRVGVLTTWLLYLTNPLSLAGDSALAARLQHTHVSTAILLWALVLYFKACRRSAFLLCGLAFDLHALNAGYVLALLSVDSAFRWRELGRRLWTGPLIAALVASPILIWLVRARDVIPAESFQLWLAIMRERSALHVFPSATPTAQYAGFALLLALAVLAFERTPAAPLRRTCARFALAVALLCLVGFVFSELIPSVTIMKAQLWRSTKWLVYLAVLFLGSYLPVAWKAGGVARAAAVFAFLGLVVHQPAFLALGLLLFLLSGRWSVPSLLVGAAAILAGARTGVSDLSEQLVAAEVARSLRLMVSDENIIICLALALLLARLADTHVRAIWRTGAVLAGCAVVLIRLFVNSQAIAVETSWHEVQRFVRDNTSVDAVILTPPYRDGFRVFSERAIVGEWKDGTQQFFSARFVFEWYARMQELGKETRAYDDFTTERLRALARRYGASYVITRGGLRHDLPVLFSNDVAVVYALGEGGPAADPGPR